VRIVDGRTCDALASLVNLYFVFCNAHYRADRKQKVSIAEPEEAAGANFEHLDLSLALVDEEIAYVADLFAVPIDDFPIADVLR
jgi:hypothetical protein